jgi:hypothetical protein
MNNSRQFIRTIQALTLISGLSSPFTGVSQPVTIVPGAVPYDMSVASGRLYWVDTASPLLQTVNPNSGAVLANLYRSSVNSHGILGLGGNVYYFTGDQRLERAWHGQGPRDLVASTVGPQSGGLGNLAGYVPPPSPSGPLYYLYWADAAGISRINSSLAITPGGPINSESVERLVGLAGEPPFWLATDGPYVYWRQQQNSGTWGLFRATIGSVQILHQETNPPSSLVVDDGYIYWASGGEIRRGPKDHPFPNPDLPYGAADGDSIVTSIVQDRDYVYWSLRNDTVTPPYPILRRAPKAGGAPETLALGTAGRLLQQDTFYLYWADANGIERLEKTAGPIRPDLSWLGIEVTQGIQNLHNDVPLVAGKPTFVRVFPTASVPDGSSVSTTALLYGTGVNGPLPGSPLAPLASVVPIRDQQLVNRVSSVGVFTFALPPSWTSGSVQLQAVLNPYHQPAEPRYDNNSLPLVVNFTAKDPVRLHVFPLLANNVPTTAFSTLDASFAPILNRFKSLVPNSRPTLVGISEPDGPFDISRERNWIIFRMICRYVFGESHATADHLMGMVSPDADTTVNGNTLNGYANYVLPVSFVKMIPTGSAPFATPRGGSVMAQELAHNYNGVSGRWLHVNCGGAGDINPNYPYPPCQFGPGGLNDNAYTGFDPVSLFPIQAGEAGDFMSYRDPPWVSDYTWRGLFNVYRTSSSLSRNPAEPAGGDTNDVLFISGQILDSGAFQAPEPPYRCSSELLSPATVKQIQAAQTAFTVSNATYAVEMLSSNQTVLASQAFEPLADHASHGEEDAHIFFLALRFQPDTARIRISHQSVEIGHIDVSGHAPKVSVLEPVGGEVFTNAFVTRWASSDLDGDPVSHMLQYSHNGGQSWEMLTMNYSDTVRTQQVALLPGGTNCLIRVVANDGINTSLAMSAPFSVQRHAPRADILSPAPFQVFTAGEQILLNGSGYDIEDGSLPDSSLAWNVETLGDLGVGGQLSIPGLPPGTYRVTLTATDSDGAAGATSATIVVAEPGEPKCGQFFTDFKLPPANVHFFGDAMVVSGIGVSNTDGLQLTAASPGQTGSIVIDDFLGLPLTSFLASFKTRVGGGKPGGGEGFSFCCANDLTNSPFGELGTGGGLIISFNTHDSGGEDAPAFDVFVHGIRIAHQPGAIATDPDFVDVEIRMREDGTMDLQYGTNLVFSRLVTGFTPGLGSRFGLGARTSALADNHVIDDLSIAVCNDDVVPPTMNTPTNLVVWTRGDSAVVNFGVGVTDDRDINPVVTCVPASGSVFLSGTTTVICTARDAAGNVSASEFVVTVIQDTVPPVLTGPSNLTFVATSSNTLPVFFVVTATDNLDPSPSVSCAPPSGSIFKVGTTIVHCKASDAAGNIGTYDFSVTVLPPDSSPRLSASLAGTNIVLSWPAAFSNYTLQAAESIAAPMWVDSTGQVILQGDQNTVEFRPIFNPPLHLFRLKRLEP